MWSENWFFSATDPFVQELGRAWLDKETKARQELNQENLAVGEQEAHAAARAGRGAEAAPSGQEPPRVLLSLLFCHLEFSCSRT